MAKERIAMTEDEDSDRSAAEELLTEDEMEGVALSNDERKARAEAVDPEIEEAVAEAAESDEDEDEAAPAPAPTPAPAAAEPPADPGPAPAAVVFTDEEKARLEALDAAVDKIADDYDNADLTRDEMKAKLKEVEAERAGLLSKQARAEESERASLDHEIKAWRADVASWQKEHPEIATLFAEGATAEQKAAGALFNDLVKKTAATDLADDISNHQLLDQALASARIRAPQAFAAPKAAAKEKEKPTVADPATRPEKVPALSRLPAADGSAADSSQFAALDKLEGEKHEAALLKLRLTNPAQHAAYMARG